jgi:AcrR family transcriptional regulator
MEIPIEQLEKISQMLMRFGIRNTSMDDIAKELGVSKKTLYNWFPSKEIMIEKVIDMMTSYIQNNPHCGEYLEKDSENAIDVILNVMTKIGEITSKINPIFFWELNKYYPVQAKKLNEFRVNKIREKYINNLERGIKEDVYRKNINIEIVTQLFLIGIKHFDETINDEKLKKYPIDVILKEIYLFNLHAIVNEKGREYLRKKIKSFEL